jgi:hypothetical protein|tara:strand:- start:1951 stop:2385 length:435 start_codon:yes stop_codon:yes gene_type:complete
MSTSLYTTFGNEVKYEFRQGVLTAYLENSTINFPLPEATSEILANLAAPKGTAINPQVLSMIQTKLEAIGFKKGNAKAMASVLIQVAKVQGVHPTTYFDMNNDTINLTVDAYQAVNAVRPAGNKVDLKAPKLNINSPSAQLIAH